jgi:hypothetical protein
MPPNDGGEGERVIMRPRFAGIGFFTGVIAMPTGAVVDPMHEDMGEAHQATEPTPLGIEESRDASGTW